MDSGSNRESKAAASGDDAVISSPGPEGAPVAGAGEEVAVSPPAPAAGPPKPYYECVYCKRGFTTAQALGGHMNIHRGDRAKRTRESPAGGMTTASRNVECYNKYRHMLSYPSTPSTAMPPIGSSSSSNFGMCYPSTGIEQPAVDRETASPSSVSPRELSLFGAATRDPDLHLGLMCHGDAGDGSSMPPEGSPQQAVDDPERELDLELRLGRRPSH